MGRLQDSLTQNPRAGMTVDITISSGATQLHITDAKLISCVLDLRTDFRMVDRTIPVSSIDVKFISDTDISALLQQLKDEPIIYKAGYTGDMSEERTFYVTEADQDGMCVTISGEDAVSHLEDVTMPLQIIQYEYGKDAEKLHEYVTGMLTSAGISLIHDDYVISSTYASAGYEVIRENDARTVLATIHALTDCRYIDAGIPHLYTTRATSARDYDPTPIWTIKKSECGSYKTGIRDVIKEIRCEDPDEYYKLMTGRLVSEDSSHTAHKVWIAEGEQCSGGKITKITNENVEGRYFLPTYYARQGYRNSSQTLIVENTITDFIAQRPDYVTLVPTVTNTDGHNYLFVQGTYLYGEGPAVISSGLTYGRTVQIKPSLLGAMCIKDGYKTGVQTGGSFIWKGDPRMQPGHRLRITDDSGNLITQAIAESIVLTHSGGGLSAEISYITM